MNNLKKLYILVSILIPFMKMQLCDLKCTYCGISQICYNCQQGYTFDTNSNTCNSNCSQGTYFFEPTQECLSNCPQGFEKDNIRRACNSINYCHRLSYQGSNEDFKYNIKAYLYQNLLVVSGKQNMTFNEQYLKIYQIKNDEYGFYSTGNLNGQNDQIISFVSLESNNNSILVSISKNKIIAWDLQYGLLKSNITLSNYLFINPNSYYLDQNILILNYFDTTQFALFYVKNWVDSLYTSNQEVSSQFFQLYNQVHPTPILGYQLLQNNSFLSYDGSNIVIQWKIGYVNSQQIYKNFNYSINQVVSFPNYQDQNNLEFFIATFQNNTKVNLVLNNNNNYPQVFLFNTNHQFAIQNIFFDETIQDKEDLQNGIVNLISISKAEIIIFQLNMHQQLYVQTTIFQQQVLYSKLINNQVIFTTTNGLSYLTYFSQKPQLSYLFSIINATLAQNDYINDIVVLNNTNTISYILIGAQLTQYQIISQMNNIQITTKASQILQKSSLYNKHYGMVNGVVMDSSQNLYISYSSDGSFAIWDVIKNNIINQKPIMFNLPPWCSSFDQCKTAILKSLIVSRGILLCLYSNNQFITWNFSRYSISLRNTYNLPSQYLQFSNYGLFNNLFYLSNNKEIQIFNFNTSETQIINNNYNLLNQNVSQVQLAFYNNTFYYIETLVINTQQKSNSILRVKLLSNFTNVSNITILQKCLELEYFQLAQIIVVNYYSPQLTVVKFPSLTQLSFTVDTDIITQIYSPIQNQFLIITKSAYMFQYIQSGNTYISNTPANVPLPRRNFGMVYKNQFTLTSSGFSYFQNTGFPKMDNQVINTIFNNLRTCSVYPFKEEISSVSIVNDQLIFVGFKSGNFKIAQYSCSTFIYSADTCNTWNTISNPYTKKVYTFDLSKIIVIDMYSKTDLQLAYGHPTTPKLGVIQDQKNGYLITYSLESTKNLYKFNVNTQVATQFLNGHTGTVDFVFLDIDNDILISHSVTLTDLKVIIWQYSYSLQLKVFTDLFIFNQQTPILSVVRALYDQQRQQVLILTKQGTLFIFNYITYTVSSQFFVPLGVEFYLDTLYPKFYILYNTYFIQIRNYQTLSLENEIQVNSPLTSQKLQPSQKWIIILSKTLITVINRYKQNYQSTILCNSNCGNFLISDKLDLTFSYILNYSDSVDIFDNKSGKYLYSIYGQQDLDIGAIKYIVSDDVNYLLFIGKLSAYITVFFNYLTQQYVGYAFEGATIYYGAAMINQFNAFQVADGFRYYLRSIEEQITSTFKFQDNYLLKNIDYYTSSSGDMYYIDAIGNVRRYRQSDMMVKLINQNLQYRQISYYNNFLYILTYTQLLKYSEEFQMLNQYLPINIYGDQIMGTLNNQIFVSTFNNTILQIDYDTFKIINTIALQSSLLQYQFVQNFTDLLLITTKGDFIRYNYANYTLLMSISAGYYYCYYNLNLSIIFIASTINQSIEIYEYSKLLSNFTNLMIANITYPNNIILNYIFIDELYNSLYAVQANDRIIDIYSYQKYPNNPSISIQKVNYIPYINSIYSVKLDLEDQYIRVSIPWSISYYNRQTYNFYWQIQDPLFIQSIRYYRKDLNYPELVFLLQNNLLSIAYSNLTNKQFKLLVQVQLDYPIIYNTAILKTFDQFLINLTILVSGDIVNYVLNIPIINGIPQQYYFYNCLVQIQDPLAGYQVQNQLTQLQNYFQIFNYQSTGIQLEIYGSQFLYYDQIMQTLQADVEYFGDNNQNKLNLEEDLFTRNYNNKVTLTNQTIVLITKQVISQFSPMTNFISFKDVSFIQEDMNSYIETLQIQNTIISKLNGNSAQTLQYSATAIQASVLLPFKEQLYIFQIHNFKILFVNHAQVLQCKNGGSISILFCLTNNISIQNSIFKNNIASSSGGALYLSSSFLNLQNVIFQDNKALIGGAIRYLKSKPINFSSAYFIENNVKFINNKADIHSQNWGSYLKSVQVQQYNQKTSGRLLKDINISNEIYQVNRITQQSNGFQINNLQSSGFINLQLQIFDEENNILSYQVQNCFNQVYPEEICIELSQLKLTLLSTDDSLVRVVGSYTAQFNEFNTTIKSFQISGIQLIGNPLTSQVIVLQILGIYQYLPLGVNDIVQNISKDIFSQNLQLNFRDCKIGEIYRLVNKIYQCVQCSVGSYSILNPNKNDYQQCQRCPEEASYCFRDQMQLKQGYWKSQNLTDNIYRCQTPSSCQGNQDQNYCSEGHYGPICQFCDEYGAQWGDKFQYDNQNGCINCSKRTIIYAVGQGLLVATILISYCIFNIVSSLRASEKVIQAYYLRMLKISCISKSSQNNEVNIAVKALTSFMQLYKLISTYSLALPQLVQLTPNLFGSPASSSLFTNSCELAYLTSQEMPHLYLKALVMIISPLIYMVGLLLIYVIFAHKKYNFILKKSHIISGFVFLLQFVQPNIVQTLISQMSCQEFDGKYYIAADYTYECYTQQHRKFIYFLIGPGLAIHSFIYPVLLLIILFKSKNKLNNAITRLRYGYIYQDYKTKGYYWEFVKYGLKLSIIFTQNFFNPEQIKTKHLALFFIVVLYYMILLLVQPYQLKKYQQIDQNSTIVLLIVCILNYFLNSSINDIQTYIFYFLLILCQYLNEGYLILSILKIYFNKYFQLIIKFVPKRIQKSFIFKFLVKKANINIQKQSQQAVKLWMIVYKKSKFGQIAQMQSFSIKQMYAQNSQINFNQENSPQILKQYQFSHKNQRFQKKERLSSLLRNKDLKYLFTDQKEENNNECKSPYLLRSEASQINTLKTQQEDIKKTLGQNQQTIFYKDDKEGQAETLI
ncbi:transmembrane protein, putative (macronuclear) [Tetrahymena thermophila SB210]|uniref:Transmembrane protein, putative n=1 Tax=Tetrahymena thermophila (strain SB210) TaxID=312017 RepID=W7XG71_TETTS|nr:transmembrane protein, putative [Tetrahymena thermophila SB210]EWS73096.1 transmembrane protein, putative [Tetrahymena thermophila SB210]|eukprot:XP_012654367.1 transmembrane protein, putative [Tetrahymena thermophila SB210]